MKTEVENKEQTTDDFEQGLESSLDIEGVSPSVYQTNLGGSPESNEDGAEDNFKQNPYLPTHLQKKAEKTLGEDFSNVNIYKNSSKAKQLGAKAFTQGDSIHFASDKFNPYSSEGQELIGHELVHIAQQKKGYSAELGKSEDKTMAEVQANRLGKAVFLDQPIGENIIPITFNSIQQKPDPGNPAEFGELQLNYLVHITESGPKSTFQRIIASQIYLNKDLNVVLAKRGGYYYKGKHKWVSVSLEKFVANLLDGAIKEDPQQFAMKENLLHQYIYNNWLVSTGNGKYKLKGLFGIENAEEIIAGQTKLRLGLLDVLKTGRSSRRNDVYIHSYKRSYYESGIYKNNDEKHHKAYTSSTDALQISDRITQHMPFKNKKDYIELIYHEIPESNQPIGVSCQYYYFNGARYLPSEILEIISFDPHQIPRSENLFEFNQENVKISWESELISKNKLKRENEINFTIKNDLENKIVLHFGENSPKNTTFLIQGNQLIVENNSGMARDQIMTPYRDKVYAENPQNNGVKTQRKYRTKRLYQNKRDRNAVHRLDQLTDYYGNDGTYKKVRDDINLFVLNQNAPILKYLEPADQLSLVILIEQTNNNKVPSLSELKEIFGRFESLLGFNFGDWRTIESYDDFVNFLLQARGKRDVKPNTNPIDHPIQIQTPILEPDTDNKHPKEAPRPYRLHSELQFLNFFINYVNDPFGGTEHFKSVLNEVFNMKANEAVNAASASNQRLENFRNVINTKDESKKLALIKEILEKQTAYISHDPWVIKLSKSDSLNQFKEILNEKPDSDIKAFFDRILDGTMLQSIDEKQKELAEITKLINGSDNIKSPLERMNNGIQQFLENNRLKATDLRKINAVFYPGEETIHQDAKHMDPMPLNLYAYKKGEAWYNVLFIDNGHSIIEAAYKSQSNSTELVTEEYLEYLDESKILSQGILYYRDAKKFTDKDDYSPNTISSYEFTAPNSNWDNVSNVTSGVLFVVSMAAGPGGWARNLMAAGALVSVSSIIASKINKSKFENLGAKDYLDLFFSVGGVALDAFKMARISLMLSKAKGVPKATQNALNAAKEAGVIEKTFKIGDNIYNLFDVSSAIYTQGFGFNEAYSLWHFIFGIRQNRTKNGHVDLMNKAVSPKYDIDKTLNYSRILNGDPNITLDASKEFHLVLGQMTEMEVKILGDNLALIKQHDQHGNYQVFLSEFGNGSKKEVLDQFILLARLSQNRIVINDVSKLGKDLNPKGKTTGKNQLADQSKVKDNAAQLETNKKTKNKISEDFALEDQKIGKAQNKMNQLNGRIKVYKHNLNEAKRTYNAALDQYQALNEKVKTKKEGLERQKRMHGLRKKRAENVFQQYFEEIENHKQTTKEQGKVQDQLNKLSDTISKDITKLEKLNVLSKKAKENKIKHANELQVTNTEIKKVENRLKQNEKLLAKLKDKSEKLGQEVDKRTNRIKQIDNHIEQSKANFDNAQTNFRNAKKDISKFDRHYKGALTLKQSAEKELLVEKRDKLKAEFMKLKKQRAANKKLEKDLRKEKLSIEKELEVYREKFNSTNDELSAQNKYIDESIKVDLEKLNDKIDPLEKKLAFEVGKEIDLSKDIVALEAKSKQDKLHSGQLEEQIETLENKKENYESKINEIEPKLTFLEDELIKSETKLSGLQQELLELQRLKESAKKKVERSREALNKAKKAENLKRLKTEVGLAEDAKNASIERQRELLIENDKLDANSRRNERELADNLAVYEELFSTELLKDGNPYVMFKLTHDKGIWNALYKLKRHQVKRMIKLLGEDRFIGVDSDLDYEEDSSDALDIVNGKIEELYNIKSDLTGNLKNEISQKIAQERERLKLSLEGVKADTELIKFELTTLEVQQTLNENPEQNKEKVEELQERELRQKEIEFELTKIAELDNYMTSIKGEKLDNFFRGERPEFVDELLWLELQDYYEIRANKVNSEVRDIDQYITVLKSLSEFIKTNYKLAIRHDSKLHLPNK